MTTHVARIAGWIALIVLCTFYPFLPGRYDALARPLSGVAQALGIVGLLLMPLGMFWLGYELRERRRRKRTLPNPTTRYYFALVSMVASSLAVIAASLGAFVGIGPSLSVLALPLWGVIIWRLTPKLKALKEASVDHFNAVPLYVVAIPSVVVILQVALAGKVTNRANAPD